MGNTTIKPFDMTGYQMFRVTDDVGNQVTIAVRGILHGDPNSDDRCRYAINLIVWGDYGPFQHYWSHAGGAGETWWNWLKDTDQDYFLKKVTDGKHMEFDPVQTERQAYRQIIDRRRHAELTKEQAREIWDDLAGLNDGSSRDHALHVLSSASYRTKGLYGQDKIVCAFEEYYDMTHERVRPSLDHFWHRLWRPFIENAAKTEGFTKEVSDAVPA